MRQTLYWNILGCITAHLSSGSTRVTARQLCTVRGQSGQAMAGFYQLVCTSQSVNMLYTIHLTLNTKQAWTELGKVYAHIKLQPVIAKVFFHS